MNLVTKDNDTKSVLTRVARRVDNPQSTEVILGIQEMKRIAYRWESETGQRCEGLAATQIGWNARVIILRASDEMMPRNPDLVPNNTEAYPTEDAYLAAKDEYREFMRVRGSVYDPWFVLINPKVVSVDGGQYSTEGCLSVPGSEYKVFRPDQIIFKYTLPNSKQSKLLVVRGKDATVLQHEIDHLNGTTIQDIASEAYVGETA